MNKVYIFAAFLLLPLLSTAQYFQAYAEYQGNDIVFFLRPNPGGGDITTGWSDIEFFLRYPDGSAAFSYGAITINSTDFPSIQVPYNGNNTQGSETGFTNSWFGTSYLPTAQQTYVDGQIYEVFRVTLDVDPSTIAFELVHNTSFFPTYLALGSHTGADLSAPTGNKFYGGAINCNCPASSNNDVLAIATALPVELQSFTAEPSNNTDALLDWATASEINVSHFEIQRSINGRTWEWIGEASAVGNSISLNRYQFKDAGIYSPDATSSVFYYRLKMTDEDETFEYSNIRAAVFKESKTQVAPIQVFPNPAHDYLQVQLPQKGDYLIALYNLQGQQVLTERNSRLLNIRQLPAGNYLLRILRDGRPYDKVHSIVIMR